MSDTANINTWPARIYLQHGDSPDVPKYEECTDVTWCWHGIEDSDVQYVRADVAADLQAALQEATAALSGGLWDYGPGQDEHAKCNEVVVRCQVALADYLSAITKEQA